MSIYLGLRTMLIGSAFFVRSTTARQWRSLDSTVQGLIKQCEEKADTAIHFPAYLTNCGYIQGCVLDNAGGWLTAQWSASASMLAFIPTITAVMSNSIEEVVQVAEEDPALATVLALCTITGFSTRFGSNRGLSLQTVDALLEHVLERYEKMVQSARSSHHHLISKRRMMYLLTCLVLLVTFTAIWVPTVLLLKYSIVVFSCPSRANVPCWVTISQALVVANALLRRHLFHRVVIFPPPPPPHDLQRASSYLASTDRPRHSIILRYPKLDFLARCIRGLTSIMTFGLFTYGTAIFGSTSMFGTAQAIMALVLYAFAAGIGRVVADSILEDSLSCRCTIVINVRPQQVDELKKRIEESVS